MGVRGLTTFIAKNSDRYMESYELKNTYLIIDGNNLAAQLYRWHAKCYDCFGGDYDQYAMTVQTFFENLQKCNITPLVIFDGCYENKKLKTIYDRVKDRVSATKNLNAATEGSTKVFPLYLRELFTEVVLSMKCKAIRCEFEADYEMACLAKTINCPILSYDSDFYIFDVLYVPFSTLDGSPKIGRDSDGKIYHYLDCKLYKMDNFLTFIGGMDKGVLPLLATIVGNDYIAAGMFKEFYAQLKMVKKRRMDSDQQRRIESVIKWLLNETYDSAAKKILSRIKREHRQKLADQIDEVANGYHCVTSTLLPYFGLDASHMVNSSIRDGKRDSQIDLSTIPEDNDGDCTSLEHDEAEEMVAEAPGELNLEKLHGNFPEWFIHQFRSCNFPAWFMDIAVHNRYFFIPQVENFEREHSHTISLDLLAAMHKMLRPNQTELTYIARQGNNYIQNHQMPYYKGHLPTLNEIPSMGPEEGQECLHNILGFDDHKEISSFLNKFDAKWRLYVLAIIFWAKKFNTVNKLHIYAMIFCGITLNDVDKQVGYIRTLKDANRKLKNAPQFASQLNFIRAVIPFFYIDEKMNHNPRKYYDLYAVDMFARFQSALFHIKFVNKLLLTPYDDFLISDFYNGTFIFNVFALLKRRSDPLSCLKQLCAESMDVFNQFLQIAIEITCKLETLEDGNKKPKKRKSRQKSGSTEPERKPVESLDEPSTSQISEGINYDPNNPFSILNVE